MIYVKRPFLVQYRLKQLFVIGFACREKSLIYLPFSILYCLASLIDADWARLLRTLPLRSVEVWFNPGSICSHLATRRFHPAAETPLLS